MRRSMLLGVVILQFGCAAEYQGVPGSTEPEVELFGVGTISTGDPEFAITFSPDGDTAYFNRTPPDRSRLDLMVSVRSSSGWANAQPFEPTRDVSAIDPFMAASGNRLFFSSNMPVPGLEERSFNLWYVDRAADGWLDPVPLPRRINSDSSDVFNSVSLDGLMVFSSRRDGRRRVYASRWSGDGWAEPEPVRFGQTQEASNPAISPDGTFLIVSAIPGGGSPDLYLSCFTGSGWSDLFSLPPPINSRFSEFAPTISNDWLYFTSERPGIVGPQRGDTRPPGDIYRTQVSVVSALCDSQEP